jgi:hypothetical protein
VRFGGSQPPGEDDYWTFNDRLVSKDDAAQAAVGASLEEGAGTTTAEGAGAVRVFANTDQTHIRVPEDRVRLVLDDLAADLRRRRDWMGPAGIMLGLGTTLLTADFKEVLGVNPSGVGGIVGTLFALSLVWTALTLASAARGTSQRRAVDKALTGLKERKSGE